MPILKNSGPDRALMPTDNGVLLLSIRDGAVYEQLATGLAQCQRHDHAVGGIVAVLIHPRGTSPRWRSVRVMMVGKAAELRTMTTLETPIPATDVVWLGGRLVICGEASTGSRAWIVDPFADQPIWRPLEMPSELESPRKGFDALVSNGRQLIAIDNIVFPKYSVAYESGHGEVPQLVRVAELAANGSYEHVHSASNGRSLFAVHSTTMGRERGATFISLYRHSSLALRAVLQLPYRPVFHAMQEDDLWLLQPDEPGVLRRYAIDMLKEPALAPNSLVLVETRHFDVPYDRMLTSAYGRIVLGTGSADGPFEIVGDE